jgi:hypothetical protein
MSLSCLSLSLAYSFHIESCLAHCKAAGMDLIPGKAGKGFSLRFPRFLRIRDDKAITDTTTPDQLVQLWHRQNNGGAAVGGGVVAPPSTDGVESGAESEEE